MVNAASIVHKRDNNALHTEAVYTPVQNNTEHFRKKFDERLSYDITPESFNFNNNTYIDFEIEEDFSLLETDNTKK